MFGDRSTKYTRRPELPQPKPAKPGEKLAIFFLGLLGVLLFSRIMY